MYIKLAIFSVKIIWLEEEQAACMNAHRSARVHRDVKPDFWSLFVDMTGEKSSVSALDNQTRQFNYKFIKFIIKKTKVKIIINIK